MHYLDYHEQKQHGTRSYPIAFYHVDKNHPRYFMPYHWHQEYEIIQVLEGELFLSLNSVELTAKAGDILFIQDGVIHGGIPNSCVYECIVFDIGLLFFQSEICRSYIRPISDHRLLIQQQFSAHQIKELPDFFSAVERLFHYASQGYQGMELSSIGSLLHVFGTLFYYRLFDSSSSDETMARHQKQQKIQPLRAVLQYIELHYAQTITLEELSAEAGMSSKYFCRFFVSLVHKTPMEYLNYYRIERACYELSLGEHSITEVGYNCGFHDTSYFIRVFKREKGITPKKYQTGHLLHTD